MLATDIRVTSINTRFGQIEVKKGIYPVGGATIRLHQEVGWGNAMRYLLTGDEISAEDAYRIGLIQEVTAPVNGNGKVDRYGNRKVDHLGPVSGNTPTPGGRGITKIY